MGKGIMVCQVLASLWVRSMACESTCELTGKYLLSLLDGLIIYVFHENIRVLSNVMVSLGLSLTF
jgi:fructose-1-phosphate kinase PfkB-like protein